MADDPVHSIRSAGKHLVRLPGLVGALPLQAFRLAGAVPRRRVGAPPGTLPEIAPEHHEPARIQAWQYSAEHLSETGEASLDSVEALREGGGTLWVDVVGARDPQTIAGLGRAFRLHPLVQEDLMHTHQRPKIELYPADDEHAEYAFVVVKMLHATADGVAIEQVGMILGSNFLITVQESQRDVFRPIQDRLRQNAGRVRKEGAGYLAYTLLDVIIDHYFAVIEDLGERIDQLEQAIVDEPRPALQEDLRSMRRAVLFVRRAIWPLREVLSSLQREDTGLLDDRTRIYLRDAYDHTLQAVELIESFRDVLSTLSDLYLSSLSHRLNEVMKVLTVVGTIFIPLSFFAGIYGMNFTYMPELEWRYGYFAFLGVVATLLVGALVVFRRRGWI